MHPSELRKYGGTVLATLAVLILIRFAYVAIFEPRNLTRPVYILEGLVVATPPGGAPLPPEPLPDWSAVLPRANLEDGSMLSRQCIGCHDLSAAMKTVFGPALHGVIGRARASVPGYDYSTAMRANRTPWTLDALFEYLRNPQLYVPGTKMSFAGLPDAQQRIELLAYLRSSSK